MLPRENPWPAILEEIQQRVRSPQFETWFRNLQMEDYSPEALTLRVPNSFFHEWLKRNYLHTIQKAVLNVTGERPEVEFVVRPSPASERAEPPPEAPRPRPPSPPPAPQREGQRQYFPVDWTARLNRTYTFANFVVGASNALPHAAALAIAESPGQAYNPFFLHGGVGLGKSHLVQAITHRVLKAQPSMRVLYLSCENFMNHFISSVQHSERERFRNVYRSLDMLIIDDIHFLCRGTREVTQEEFFHTFNALYNAGRQIVLSSDSPPRELTKLEERLVSRFKWGLVARIDPPSYETRVAILRKKADARGRRLPDDVLHFIAENIDTNIRDLEGAVTKVIGFASVANKPIDTHLTRQALRDTVQRVAAAITMDDVISAVTNEFRIKLSELQSKKRSKSVAHPRQIAMYLARSLTRHSLEEIGGYFGGRDHTTVMHACEKIRRLIASDPAVAATVESLTTRVRNTR
ncbi:MAG: chromosomal replication initiator protein DnaA [Candidatus Brocadiia bacterium]